MEFFITEILKGRKREPIGTVHGEYKKLAEGKWVHVSTGETKEHVKKRIPGKLEPGDWSLHGSYVADDPEMGDFCAHCGKNIKQIIEISDGPGEKQKVGLDCAEALVEGSGTNKLTQAISSLKDRVRFINEKTKFIYDSAFQKEVSFIKEKIKDKPIDPKEVIRTAVTKITEEKGRGWQRKKDLEPYLEKAVEIHIDALKKMNPKELERRKKQIAIKGMREEINLDLSEAKITNMTWDAIKGAMDRAASIDFDEGNINTRFTPRDFKKDYEKVAKEALRLYHTKTGLLSGKEKEYLPKAPKKESSEFFTFGDPTKKEKSKTLYSGDIKEWHKEWHVHFPEAIKNITEKKIKKSLFVIKSDHVSSIAVMHGDKLLMGKRRDNGRWTLPGGHADEGESKEDCAKRELKEESGITCAGKLKHLGSEKVTTFTGKKLNIHSFRYNSSQSTSMQQDPDQEVERWHWVDTKDGISDEIMDNLHSPKNTTLKLLGFQKSDKIPGGLADKKKPKDFDSEGLKQGVKVEREHTSDPKIATEIAMDHLTEDPKYYVKLKKIEKSLPHKYLRKVRVSGKWVYYYHQKKGKGYHAKEITEEHVSHLKELAEGGHKEAKGLVDSMQEVKHEVEPKQKKESVPRANAPGESKQEKLIDELKTDLMSQLNPSETEGGGAYREIHGSEEEIKNKLGAHIHLRDVDSASMARIYKKYKARLDKLGIRSQIVPSEKGWRVLDFEWKGRIKFPSLDKKIMKELVSELDEKTKAEAKKRGWKYLGVFRRDEKLAEPPDTQSIFVVFDGPLPKEKSYNQPAMDLLEDVKAPIGPMNSGKYKGFWVTAFETSEKTDVKKLVKMSKGGPKPKTWTKPKPVKPKEPEKPKKHPLPEDLSSFEPMWAGESDPNNYMKELDRYRRHDHGGGEDGDDWLDDEEIDDDYNEGAKKYKHVLKDTNRTLKENGYEPNAEFELGEKGHFSIVFYLTPKVKKSEGFEFDLVKALPHKYLRKVRAGGKWVYYYHQKRKEGGYHAKQIEESHINDLKELAKTHAGAKELIDSIQEVKHEVEPKKSEPKKKEFKSPRKEAEEFKSDYVNDRKSIVEMRGTDVIGSARHRAYHWKSLKDALGSKDAEKLFTRDFLLQEHPINFIDQTNESNYEKQLYLHFALNKFPKKPVLRINGESVLYVDGKPSFSWRGSSEEGKVPREEHLKREREAYYDVFSSAKEIIEHYRDKDGGWQMEDRREFTQKLYELYGMARKKYGSSSAGTDAARAFYNSTVNRGTSGPMGRIFEFKAKAKEKGITDASDAAENLTEAAKFVMEGKSINKVFGMVDKRKERVIDLRNVYDTKKMKRDGPKSEYKGIEQALDILDKKSGGKYQMFNLQWGKTTTDEERVHALKSTVDSFNDLTDILKLPPEMASFNGRLAIGFGSRGRGGALAHYEPSLVIINLTRKNGAGSLCHEWGHFFDHIVGNLEGSDANRGKLGPQFESKRSPWGSTDKPVHKEFQELFKSDAWSNFQSRLKRTESFKSMRATEQTYWTSQVECWARSFEVYVANKLKKEGRQNTYLVAERKTAHVGGESMWPTDKEIEAMSPHFDKIFEVFRKSEYLKKSLSFFILD